MRLASPDDNYAAVHHLAHDTEIAAASAIHPITGARRLEAFGHLYRAGSNGLTDDEGGRLMDGDRLDFGRRRFELVENGWVEKTTKRRPTPRGRMAVVWEVTEGGRLAYERVISS